MIEEAGEIGAPKGTILELFWLNSCQSCRRMIPAQIEALIYRDL